MFSQNHPSLPQVQNDRNIPVIEKTWITCVGYASRYFRLFNVIDLFQIETFVSKFCPTVLMNLEEKTFEPYIVLSIRIGSPC